MARPAAWGAIFDWDGVVIDSSAFHEAAWETVAAQHGLPLPPDHFKRGFGMRNEEVIPGLLGWTRDPATIARISEDKEAAYRELVRTRGVVPLPGVVAMLEALGAAGVPCAVASSAYRKNLAAALDPLGLERCFAAIVTGDDVVRGKPDPAVFLEAARRLGVAPNLCVVFEDAPAGIEGARRAGMKTVALCTTHPAAAFPPADKTIAGWSELTLAELAAWWA